MSITAVAGKVRWEMTPGRARKVAAVLRRFTLARSEADRLESAADRAEEPGYRAHLDRAEEACRECLRFMASENRKRGT